MTCKKHTAKPHRTLSENGGAYPNPKSRIPTIASVEKKIKYREKLTEADAQALLGSKRKDEIMISAVLYGYKFSMDMLMILGNPIDDTNWSVALHMAEHEHKFTVEEILLLGNPKDRTGWGIGHSMAYHGHKFSVEELLKLDDYGHGVPGWRESHTMAQNGDHFFTVEELLRLGNPRNNDGQTLSDMMIEYGHQFTEAELELLHIETMDKHDPKRSVWKRLADGATVPLNEVIQYPDLLEKYADRLV